MAFATRSLRFLCKVYNSSAGATYSTFRQPIVRITLVQTAQKYYFSTEHATRPKIAKTLTNFQPAIGINENGGQQSGIQGNKHDASQEENKEEKKQQTKVMKYSFTFIGVVMGLGLSYLVYELGRPNHDEHGNIIEDEFSHLPIYEQIYKRVKKELLFYKKLVQEPSREKLLPDPLKYPYMQPPYTLVLELRDVLVHPDWTYHTGWRFKKRPGVDQFLEAVAPPQFEIVIYTAEQGLTVFPILDALDPNGYIMYRLVRDATRFVDGHHVKDLNALNRDLSKVIVVDWNSESVQFHPENTLIIPRWNGNDDDTLLHDLAVFLKTIHSTNVQDVRDVLNYYRQFDNPLEAFRENQRKLLQMEEEQNKAKKESGNVLTSKWKPSFLRNR